MGAAMVQWAKFVVLVISALLVVCYPWLWVRIFTKYRTGSSPDSTNSHSTGSGFSLHGLGGNGFIMKCFFGMSLVWAISATYTLLL
jgi:hypothetical protein